jgi:hypothetical protein
MSFKKVLLVPIEMIDDLIARPRPTEKEKTKKGMSEVLSHDLPNPRDQLRIYNTLLNNYLHYQKEEKPLKKEDEKRESEQKQPKEISGQPENPIKHERDLLSVPSQMDATYSHTITSEDMDFDENERVNEYDDVKPKILKRKKNIGKRIRVSTRPKKKPKQFGEGCQWIPLL